METGGKLDKMDNSLLSQLRGQFFTPLHVENGVQLTYLVKYRLKNGFNRENLIQLSGHKF